MPQTLHFLSRYLVLSLRRFGLAQTDSDSALMINNGHWSLPSGADGEYCAEELHDLVVAVASEQAGVGPQILWLLVADAESSGVWTALEVQQSLTLFN